MDLPGMAYKLPTLADDTAYKNKGVFNHEH